ncbi:ribosome biogenesis protein bop1-A [Haemaphysalis longicornis]
MPPKRLKAKAPAKPASKAGEARKSQAATSDSQQLEDDSDSSVYSDLGSEEDDSSELDESASEADEGDISSQDENDEGHGTDDESGDEFVEELDDVEQQTDDESENEESTKMKFVGGNEDDFLLGKKQKAASRTPKAEPGKRSSEAVKQEDAQIESSGSKVDEYAFDSSDEEDVRNTVGNIPMEWYEHYPHIGYDLDGKPILKPPRGNELDEFLRRMDDPNYWRTVKDKSTGQNVVLSDEDVDLIQRLQQGRYPSATYDPYEPFEDIFSHEKMIHPVTSHPPQKRSFVPSKIEKQMVSRMVHAIKMGWIKPRVKRDDPNRFSLLWDKDDEDTPNDRMQRYIPAPKMKLPGHEESYNPPPEYLFTKEEEEKWREQEPEERRINFIPRKYSCLRLVPAYDRFINERFARCLDLYLCPRQRKMRVNVDAEDLIPQLPKPKDLQPFPSVQSIVYEGHTDCVRGLSLEPAGQFFASGSDDGTVRIWEVLTGRCLKTFKFEHPVRGVAWCPNQSICLVAVALEKTVHIINPGVGDKLVLSNTDTVLSSLPEESKPSEGTKFTAANWEAVSPASEEFTSQGLRLSVVHRHTVSQVTWHAKGDYFAVVLTGGSGGESGVVIHQLSHRRSQAPFAKLKGTISKVLFHPVRPYFFVAMQRFVRVYNLLKQELSKKLISNCKWISSIAVHPKGDNVITGSFENRLTWFDMDLSVKPYKTLRHHKGAIRQVTFHRRYPLFASASDDGTVIISHGMVYSDLMQNPLIVPVKILRGHSTQKGMGVLDCAFHPQQPWVITAGADATLRLFT